MKAENYHKSTVENNEELFKAIVEQSSSVLTIYDNKGYLVCTSKKAPKFFGLEESFFDNLIGKYNVLKDEQFSNTEILESIKKAYAGESVEIAPHLYEGKKSLNDLELQSSSVKDIWIKNFIYPIKNKKGIVTHIVNNLEDISKEIEAKEHKKVFFEDNISPVYHIEFKKPISVDLPVDEQVELIIKNGIISDANDPAIKLYEYENRNELIGKTIIEFNKFNSDEGEGGKNAFNSLVQNNYQVVQLEKKAVKKDGSCMWLLTNIQGTVKNNFLINLKGSITDITDKKRAELELKHSEDRYRTLSNLSKEGIFIHRNGLCIEVNKAFSDIFGYSTEEAVDKLIITDILTEESIKKVQPNLKSDKNIKYDLECIKKDGSKIWIESEAKPINFKGENARVATFYDITQKKKAQTDLIASEKRFETLFDSANDTIFIYKDDNLFDCNHKAAEMFRGSKEEILQKKPWEISPVKQADGSDSMERVMSNVNKVLNGEPQFFEWQHKRLDGEVFDTEVNLSAFSVNSEIFIQGIVRDITDRKKAENKIRESEIRLKEAQELAKIGNWELNLETNELYWSDEVHNVFEIDKGSFNNTHEAFKNCIHPEDRERVSRQYQNHLDNKEPYNIEFRLLLKNNIIKYVHEQCESEFDKNGKPIISKGTVQDITARKKVENDLKKSEKRFKDVSYAMADWIWETDAEGRYTWSSGNVKDILGYEVEEIIGKTPFDLMSEAEAQKIRAKFEDIVKNKKHIVDLENWNVKKNGEAVCILTNGVPVFDNKDNLIGYRGIDKDISDRKRAENEINNLNLDLEERVIERTNQLEKALADVKNSEKTIKESEQKYRELTELLPAAIFEVDLDENITYANNYIYEYTGYTKAEIENGIKIHDVIAPEDYATVVKNISGRVNGEPTRPVEYNLVHKNGNGIPSLGYSSLIVKNGKPSGIRGIMMDISDQKNSEREIRKLSEALVHSPSIVAITDSTGIIEYVNPKFENVSGYTLEEVKGKNMSIINSGVHDKNFIKQMWNTINKGEVWQGELCNKKKDGELYWESVSISSIKNKSGEISHYVGVKEDITIKKKLEEDLIIAKIEAENANKAKSEFLANMSHEIRTPMNAIIGFSEILGNTIEDETNLSYLESIRSSGKNLLKLINDILDLSKIEAGKFEIQPEYINPKYLFNEIKSLFELKAKEKQLDFKFYIDSKVPSSIFIDEVRLRQVILNLLSNAFKFTENGEVIVKVNVEEKHGNNNKLNSLNIEITDTGIGIAKDNLEKVFDSFEQQDNQSIKEFGGTGLGLSISKNLVEKMNGNISVKSELGEGSTFKITFNDVNFSEEEQKEEQSHININTIEFKPSTILVVDDIKSNRDYILAALKNTNLKTIEAENGKQALEVAIKEKPDLIISDLKMPVMDGFEFLNEIRKNNELKDTPVIASTASAMSKEQEEVKNYDFTGNLVKPVALNDLYQLLMDFLPFTEQELDKKDNSDTKTEVSYDMLVQIPQVLSKLETEFTEQWNKLQERQAMREVKNFANNLHELGENNKNKIVIDFSKTLKRATESFDIELMHNTINGFPELIKNLKELLAEN